jgi:hydroxymethylpyrimidine pyrophosphatase-like HAD family hydrolase
MKTEYTVLSGVGFQSMQGRPQTLLDISMKPIRLVFSDNEGCITPGKGLAFPLDDFIRLRGTLKGFCHSFSVCTGRSVSYVEALAQALDLLDSTVPCVCEGGAVLYWPKLDHSEALSPLPEEKDIVAYLRPGSYRVEVGKIACLSVYPSNGSTLDDILQDITKHVNTDAFNITTAGVAVDITARGVDKGYGIREVCKRASISLTEVLCVGDSLNDIPMLTIAGFSACPNNAVAEVKRIVDFVAPSDSTRGLLEILDKFRSHFVS